MTKTNAIITKTYNDSTILLFREDGWFNMTKAAKAFGKEVKEFMSLPSTVDYLDALQNVGNSHLYDSKRGRNGGTWAHPSWPCSSPAGWTPSSPSGAMWSSTTSCVARPMWISAAFHLKVIRFFNRGQPEGVAYVMGEEKVGGW